MNAKKVELIYNIFRVGILVIFLTVIYLVI